MRRQQSEVLHDFMPLLLWLLYMDYLASPHVLKVLGREDMKGKRWDIVARNQAPRHPAIYLRAPMPALIWWQTWTSLQRHLVLILIPKDLLPLAGYSSHTGSFQPQPVSLVLGPKSASCSASRDSRTLAPSLELPQ